MVTDSYLQAPATSWMRRHVALTWTLGTAAAILAGPLFAQLLIGTSILEGDLGLAVVGLLISGIIGIGLLAGLQGWILSEVLDPPDRAAGSPLAWVGAVLLGACGGLVLLSIPSFLLHGSIPLIVRGLVLAGALGGAQVLVARRWRFGSVPARQRWLWAWVLASAASGAALYVLILFGMGLEDGMLVALAGAALLFGAATGDLLALRCTEPSHPPGWLRYYRGAAVALVLGWLLINLAGRGLILP